MRDSEKPKSNDDVDDQERFFLEMLLQLEPSKRKLIYDEIIKLTQKDSA